MPTVRRALRMVRRYGLSEKRMVAALSQMSSDSKNHGIGITIPVAGEILTDDRADFLKSLCHDGFEIAVHGFHHEDFSSLSEERLREDIARAKEVFGKYGFHPTGYRAPYLRSRADLLPLLAENGFAYGSSRTLIFDRSLAKNKTFLDRTDEIAIDLYGSKRVEKMTDSVERVEDTVEIPVSLPDDEIIIDRMGIKENDLLEILIEDTIRSALRFSSFAIIQIHPERYMIARKALLSVASRLSGEGVNFITINSLADMINRTGQSPTGGKRYVCISGDLDIMSIWDLWW